MTKPGGPPEATDKVVEMDAMDVWEWEQEQRTPQASDANLAALVRESTKAIEPIAEAPPRKTPLVARGRVTGLVSPQPSPPGVAPAASGMRAETPALPIEKITPAVPIPVIEVPPAQHVPTVNPVAPAGLAAPVTPAPPANPVVPVRPAPPAESAPPAKSPPPVKLAPLAKPAPPAKPAVTAKPAPPAKPALPRAVSLRTSEVPPLPRSPLRSPTGPDPESMPSSSRPLSPMRVGIARAGSALSSVDAGPASVAEPASPFGVPAPSVPLANIVEPVVPSLAAPASIVEPASVAEPANVAEPASVAEPAAATGWQPTNVAEPASVAEPAAATGWQPASVAGSVASARAQPALDEVGHRASSPLPVETGIARMASPWPASIELAHGPYPLAAPDPAASLPAGPGSRRGRRERRATVKTRGLLAVAASRRKVLWIGGTAGFVVLVAVLVLVGGGKPRVVAISLRADDHAQGAVPPRSTPAAPDVQAAPPARTTAALDTPAVPAPPAPAKAPVSDAPAVRPAPRPVKQLGGKKLVVEYIEREGEVATPGLVAKTAEDPAIGRARSAYLSGNQKLFAGDAASAIYAYRQALAQYPGYVGGYRGLGLAYAQLGDTPKALESFRTYMTAVPNAKDIVLIKKRIARLQTK